MKKSQFFNRSINNGLTSPHEVLEIAIVEIAIIVPFSLVGNTTSVVDFPERIVEMRYQTVKLATLAVYASNWAFFQSSASRSTFSQTADCLRLKNLKKPM